MALTATATQGFEPHRFWNEGEIIWVPMDPGDTLTKGDLVTCTAGEGVVDILADSEVPYGVVLRTTVAPSLATAFPSPATFDSCLFTSTEKTLVPIMPLIAGGTPVLLSTFAGHYDDTVITYTAATPQVALTTGCTADNNPSGALVYVYDGPGAGEVNMVDSYDHTGGAVEKMLVLHRAFSATITSSSKIIIVGGENASNKGVSILGRMDAQDVNNLHAADGADDGNFLVVSSWEKVGGHLKNLMLPVVDAQALLTSG